MFQFTRVLYFPLCAHSDASTWLIPSFIIYLFYIYRYVLEPYLHFTSNGTTKVMNLHIGQMIEPARVSWLDRATGLGKGNLWIHNLTDVVWRKMRHTGIQFFSYQIILKAFGPVDCGCRIHRLHLCRAVRLPQWVSLIWRKTVWW